MAFKAMHGRRGGAQKGANRSAWTLLLFLTAAGAGASSGILAMHHRQQPMLEPPPSAEAASAADTPNVRPLVQTAGERLPPPPAQLQPSETEPRPAQAEPTSARTEATPAVMPPTPVPATPAIVAASPAPAAAPGGPARGHWAEAQGLLRQGLLGAARDKAFAALNASPDPALRRAIEDALGDIHTRMVFSRTPMPEKRSYTIVRGDTLAGIARAHGTTVELVMKGNLLRSAAIRSDDRLHILTGTFRAVVDVSRNELTLRLNDRFFKRYGVATGKNDTTPKGTFKITDRVAKPTWWWEGRAIPYGHPDNELGTHWMALDARGYGIHGTWQPESIGKAESAGCIRMHNKDVEELFALLPAGATVTIHP